ncbi:MAG: hypothetical protein ABI742_09815 [Gemmatimonadota bacterium]
MKRVFVLAGALAAMATATPASAQVTLGWDAAVFSSYVWRGVTYTNKPVFQPDLYLTIPVGAASITAGGWANVDIGKYDGATDLSESGGSSAFNLAEFDWWGEIGVPVGVATLTGGATGYIFPNDVGFTKASNTVEVYGKIALATPLSPKLSAYYDVDKIKGLYVEGSIAHGIPLGAATLTLGALAGWTGGQEINSSKPNELFNFNDKGLTHIDLSASVGFSAGPLSITPSIHGVFGQDEFTKFTKANSKSDFKIWGGATISWSKAFGGKEEEPAEK